MGIAIGEGLVNVLPFKDLFDKVTQELSVRYKMIPYNSTEDITKAINDDIDASYLASGFFLNKNDITKIASKLIEEKTHLLQIQPLMMLKMGLWQPIILKTI